MIRLLLFALLYSSLMHADITLSKNTKGLGLSLGIMGVGVSYEDLSRHTQYQLDYFYNEQSIKTYDDTNDDQHSETQISLHYRRYFKPQNGGYYYGGFVSYASLEGKLKDEFARATQQKIGVGGEVGYTSFNMLDYEQLFWSSSVGLGIWLDDKNRRFEGDELISDQEMILYIDIIRIGYVF